MDILHIMGNTAVIYILVLFGLRFLGKKQLGQLSVTDVLFIMLVSEAVGDPMRASHNSLLAALVAAFTLIMLDKLFGIAMYRFPGFRRMVDGIPSVIVHKGRPDRKEMKRNRVTISDVEQAGRESGRSSVSDIPMAVLEVDGKISILDDDKLKTESPVKK